MFKKLFLCSLFLSANSAFAKPNFVYLMVDELGYYELSHMGNPHIKTPNIDRMAAEGIRFTQALAGSAVCAPTRGVLMTGKHSGHTSVRKNGGGTPLRAGEETIGSVLKRAGYATGGFGKWGCGGRGSTGVPEKHGFDVFFGYYDQVHAHSYYPPYLVRNSEEVPLANNQGGSTGETYAHYEIYQAGVAFIKANKDRPFFCYLPFTPPHGIFDIPDVDPAWALYKDKDWPEQAKRYAAMVSMIDRQVGEIIDLLKELDLDENTLMFFCGDNGGNDYFKSKEFPRGIHGANKHPETGVEFRGKKGNLYEGGLRIPMIARWPGKINPGQVSDLLWYFPDVMPTLAELAGAETPGDIDGLSIVPTLIGKGKQAEHEYLYWEIGSQTAVRMGEWKAYRGAANKAWELYDLRTDISETTSVADKHPEVLAKMTAVAESAHEECIEGVFADDSLHQRDRQAKFGFKNPAKKAAGKKIKAAPVQPFPMDGLVPREAIKLLRASSAAISKPAGYAFDGDPRSHWHSNFTPKADPHPHELVIDLGEVRSVRGFRYLARQDNGWNGALADCEFYLSNDPKQFAAKPHAKATFKKVRTIQNVSCEPVSGRYLKLKVLSEVSGGPWASISEFGVVAGE